MNIWVVNQYALAPDGTGGTRHYSFAKSMNSRGHNVTIVASDVNYVTKKSTRLKGREQTKLEKLQGVQFLWLRSREHQTNFGRILGMLIFATEVIKQLSKAVDTPPDCIIGSSPNLFAAFGAYLLARKHRAIFVLEVRDLWPQSFIDLKVLPSWHPLILVFKLIERFLYKNSDQVVTLLERSIDFICKRGAKRENIIFIPNGVDFDLIPPTLLETQNKTLTFMYAGSHGVPNDLDFILDVINEVNARGYMDRCAFRFIGDGPKKSSLLKKKESLNLRNVSFEPSVPKENIYELLNEADVFLLSMPNSPLYKWGFSLNKLFDYMAMRRPVLFFNEAEYDPILLAQAGISVKYRDVSSGANGLVEILKMPANRRRELGLNGRKYIEANHNIHNLSKLLETKIESLLHNRRSK